MRLSTRLINHGGILRLPGRFTVKVEILDKHDARNELDAHALAQYVLEEHLVQLRLERTPRQRRADLEHELHHAAIEWIDHVLRKAK